MIMEEKINIAELLKDCPKGMELDCVMSDKVTFDYIDVSETDYPIVINTPIAPIRLTINGCYYKDDYAKCVIFPKGQTTWEGFVPPCKYKAGDVLVSKCGNIVLLSHIDSKNIVHYHCIIPNCGNFRIEENTSIGVGKYYQCYLANEQQRQRMYDRIKCSGYKYNQHINKLEKLVEPKFKVGDKIKHKTHISQGYVVTEIKNTHYILDDESALPFVFQDEYELVPNKFDITTLIPFESRVLVRDSTTGIWYPEFFGCLINSNNCPYMVLGGNRWKYCVPYEGNEHLLETNNDCDEYYKTWE